jgi:predicted membrane protein
MKIFLGVMCVVFFWTGAYFMGNLVLSTFGDPFFFDRLMSTLYGVLLWAIICIVIFISCGIFLLINHYVGDEGTKGRSLTQKST